MSVTTIYLARHGQTEWNVERRFQGHRDSPLTVLGTEQAKWLGRALQGERLDAAFASPSARAYRTAELALEGRGLAPIAEEALMEIGLGVWEGMPQSEAETRDPEAFAHFWRDPAAFAVEGSETFPDVARRSVALLERIVREHRGRSLLLVTHTVVVKLLMAHAEGRSLRALWEPPYIHPASLCKLEIGEGRTDILLHGDIGHYPERPATAD